jgi:hypothetical protein
MFTKYDSSICDTHFKALILDREFTTSFTLQLPNNTKLGDEEWKKLAVEQIAKLRGVAPDSITLDWSVVVKDPQSYLRDKLRLPNKYILVATITGINAAEKLKITSQKETIAELTHSKSLPF